MTIKSGRFFNLRTPFFRPLTVAGDGTGATNANVNASGAPQVWSVGVPAGASFLEIFKLQIMVFDGGGDPSFSDWGFIAGGVANGLTVRTKIAGVTTVGANFKTSLDLVQNCTRFFNRLMKKDEWLICGESNFMDDFGCPLVLDASANDRLEIVVNDNFTGLIQQSFTVFGRTW